MAKKKTTKKTVKKSSTKSSELTKPEQTELRVQLLTGVAISSPVPNGPYIMPSDTINVKGTSNAPTVRLLVLLNSETADPMNSKAVDVDLSSSTQFDEDVTYGGSSASPPETGTYKVAAWPISGIGTIGALVETSFTRRPETETKTVSATCCLWYALSSPSAVGPYSKEDPVSGFFPVGVRLPLNASSVSFSADSSDMWQHGPTSGSQADADGRPGVSVGLQNSAYQSSTYNSDNTSILNADVCKLAGLWKTSSTDYEIFAIGLSSSKSIPLDATLDGLVYLGMHDGKRWFNNQGEIEVTIDWSE